MKYWKHNPISLLFIKLICYLTGVGWVEVNDSNPFYMLKMKGNEDTIFAIQDLLSRLSSIKTGKVGNTLIQDAFNANEIIGGCPSLARHLMMHSRLNPSSSIKWEGGIGEDALYFKMSLVNTLRVSILFLLGAVVGKTDYGYKVQFRNNLPSSVRVKLNEWAELIESEKWTDAHYQIVSSPLYIWVNEATKLHAILGFNQRPVRQKRTVPRW